MEKSLSPRGFIDFLSRIEKMKCNTRHSYTSSGRHESVAEHSYRLSLMAYLLKDAFPDIDTGRVLEMCLVHDWGEAVTGDIPSFEKTGADESEEQDAVTGLLSVFPEGQRARLSGLFDEFSEQKTPEARLCRALDKLEAVLQHNEADLSTWLPLERELNLIYGEEECGGFELLSVIRALARSDSEEKLSKDKV